MTRDMNSLNVLMVTPRYFPYMGGTETHVHEVGPRLVRNGVDITLLTTAPHHLASLLPKEQDVEGMHVIRVQAWPSGHDFYISPEIYSIIKYGKWDLVHCQVSHTFVAPLAMFAAKEAKIPYIITFHTGGHSWCQLYPDLLNKPGHVRSRRPSPFGFPSVPSAFQEAMGADRVFESIRAGTYPLRTNASPTTLFVHARLHAGLAWIIGVALPRLLPRDL